MKTLQEYLIDALRSTYIYEMAENQKRCEDTVKSECKNILENLTLINYFRISGLHTTNISHWKKELRAAIYNASMFKMRKDNSVGRRTRITNRAMDDKDMRDHNEIWYKLQIKFREEEETQYNGKGQTREWLDEAIYRTISQMDHVCTIIVSRDFDELSDFIQKL